MQDLIVDKTSTNAYFQSFASSFEDYPEKKANWLARENEFQRLDQTAWCFLKQEALPYLTSRHQLRDWEQLISTLNIAKAYCYLLDIGCSNVRFIPRSSQKGIKTPDIEGDLSPITVLCEVKTVNCSKEELNRRQMQAVGTTHSMLSDALLKKIHSTLTSANEQLQAFDISNTARHIAFVILNFDDLLAEYKDNYYQQIDEYLSKNKIPHLEVVFYNQITAIPTNIAMNNACVVNESAHSTA